MDDRSDEDLLFATPGEAAAFGVFYERHERAVGAYFMHHTRNAELAADLTAETFAAALIGARRFRGTAAATTWLFGIAHNLLKRSYERRSVEDRARRQLGIELPLTNDVVEHFERLASDATARVMLEGLAPDQADAVRARVIDESSYADIAERLEVSESVIRQRVSRGLAALRSRGGKAT
ncbi:MAG: RNA polymerase sigma factor [Solirubrobacteraceae bacterium]